ncbi:hypothetical protein CHS0354_028906 [Potamilus streckersoni]|uniref:Sulfotransferase domain-containing protein n=1 Tax=Potamilus streckersoni TaxID=2493646 RepID=A0AAE0SB92_9BIVA|nr:hypothetical protein CHS0354_028906 [Potamilus streckersoni]
MSVVKIADNGGHTMNLTNIDGYNMVSFRQPEIVREIFYNIPQLKCRHDDVFVCASSKSGTHWTWEIVSMLLTGKAEIIPKSKVAHMLEAMLTEIIDEIPSPRVLNSHLHLCRLPREALEKKCKFVFILRDPRDVAVSLYHHCKGISLYEYDGMFENFLPLFLEGKLEYNNYLEYVAEWEKALEERSEIHLIYYEDLKTNCIDEVRKLALFLGVTCTDDLIRDISYKCSFEQMKVEKEKYPLEELRQPFFRNNFSMFRKGATGEWKNTFTVAQNEYFDSMFLEKMKNSKLLRRYT